MVNMTAPTELCTERLRLRGFSEVDIPAIVHLAGAPEIAATTLLIPHPYKESDAMEFLTSAEQACKKGEAVVFAITSGVTGELYGAVGLHPDRPQARAELGFWMGVPYWGRGYCTEAIIAAVRYGFREVNLNRIFAMAFSSNAASRRVLRKAGFRHEGCLRSHVVKWGEFHDLECYGILSTEQL